MWKRMGKLYIVEHLHQCLKFDKNPKISVLLKIISSKMVLHFCFPRTKFICFLHFAIFYFQAIFEQNHLPLGRFKCIFFISRKFAYKLTRFTDKMEHA